MYYKGNYLEMRLKPGTTLNNRYRQLKLTEMAEAITVGFSQRNKITCKKWALAT